MKPAIPKDWRFCWCRHCRHHGPRGRRPMHKLARQLAKRALREEREG